MENMIGYLTALGAGLVLGWFYFSVLWYVVKKTPSVPRPALLVFGSYLFRVAVVLFAFYLTVHAGDWRHLMICLAGFVIARFFLTHRIQSPLKNVRGGFYGYKS